MKIKTTNKPHLTLAYTYKKGTYVPGKSDVIKLIKKDVVTIYISKQERYSDGKEILTVVITHP